MTRDEAIARLQPLVGKDLRPLADEYRVTVWKNGRKNKGWAGEVLERHLGLAKNSRQAPDFGEWDLKLVSLRRRAGRLVVKETMAITMIQPGHVIETPFEHSHLLSKLQRLVVPAREWVDERESRSPLVKVVTFDLGDGELFRQVQADYETIRAALRQRGVRGLTGALGALVQARTKGAGGGSESRAFYARETFVARMLRLD
jgi:DNA mismatch repair protein MutH